MPSSNKVSQKTFLEDIFQCKNLVVDTPVCLDKVVVNLCIFVKQLLRYKFLNESSCETLSPMFKIEWHIDLVFGGTGQESVLVKTDYY